MSNDIESVEGYEELLNILKAAYDQASKGKGAHRHANNKPFAQQPIMKLQDLYGIGFALGQAGKKMEECQRMNTEDATKELFGAIVYIAGAILHLSKSPTPSLPTIDQGKLDLAKEKALYTGVYPGRTIGDPAPDNPPSKP